MADDIHGRGKEIRGAELRLKCVELRKRGLTYRQIADQTGVTFQTAFKHVQKAMAELAAKTSESADLIRQFELSRLDDVLFALWPNRRDPAYAKSILAVMDRRAKYLGLDAPTKVEGKLETDTPMSTEERLAAVETLLAAARERREQRDKGGEGQGGAT